MAKDARQRVLDPARQGGEPLCGLKPQWAQRVIHMGRHHVMHPPDHEAIRFELLQGLRQHPFADAADLAAQFGKPVGAGQQNQHDQRSPPACQMLQHLTRRALDRQNIGAKLREGLLCVLLGCHVRLCCILTKIYALPFRK